jgi:hypothetical protein
MEAVLTTGSSFSRGVLCPEDDSSLAWIRKRRIDKKKDGRSIEL